MFALFTTIKDVAAARWRALKETGDAGEVSEKVLIVALMVIATIVIVGIIVTKITDKANSINFE